MAEIFLGLMSPRVRQLAIHSNMYGYRGIKWDSNRGKFTASVVLENGRRKYSKRFDTAEEAALAYDELAREFYGREAFLNFPRDGERKCNQSRRDENKCPRGHDFRENGIIHAGYVIGCRICRKIFLQKACLKRTQTSRSIELGAV